MRKVVCILVFSFLTLVGQVSAGQHLFDSTLFAQKLDSLKNEFSEIAYQGKWQTSFYAALSHYPEFKQTIIIFKSRNISTTMQCRPKVFSVFRKSEKRKFLMLFNHNQGRSRGVELGELSFNARVGLFAHELAHVLDYLQLSTMQFAGLGFQYMNKRGKRRLEHKIDRIVIWKGMGYQILKYATETLKNQSITEDYRKRRKTIYLQPSELKELISIVENKSRNVKR